MLESSKGPMARVRDTSMEMETGGFPRGGSSTHLLRRCADEELDYARQHFFLPHRYRDPFHTDAVSTETFVSYDDHDLLVKETRDALGNRVTVGERIANGDSIRTKPGTITACFSPVW